MEKLESVKVAFDQANEAYQNAKTNYEYAASSLQEVEDVSVEADKIVAMKSNELSDLKEQLTELERELKEKQEAIKQLTSQVTQKERDLKTYEYHAFLKQNLIGYRRAEMSIAEKEMVEKEQVLKEKANLLESKLVYVRLHSKRQEIHERLKAWRNDTRKSIHAHYMMKKAKSGYNFG